MNNGQLGGADQPIEANLVINNGNLDYYGITSTICQECEFGFMSYMPGQIPQTYDDLMADGTQLAGSFYTTMTANANHNTGSYTPDSGPTEYFYNSNQDLDALTMNFTFNTYTDFIAVVLRGEKANDRAISSGFYLRTQCGHVDDQSVQMYDMDYYEIVSLDDSFTEHFYLTFDSTNDTMLGHYIKINTGVGTLKLGSLNHDDNPKLRGYSLRYDKDRKYAPIRFCIYY